MLSALADMKIKENTILTSRTARYYTIGEANQETTDVWIVCHGYGQLAKYFIKHFQVWDDGKTFVLAGIPIKSDFGIEAHSDGDLLSHSICDALLGALDLGDIGMMFTSSNQDFKGIYSLHLL